jgi:predicted transcriptional regulator
MAMNTDEHPLQGWLDRQGIKAWRFADDAKISRVTIYKLIQGREPNLATLVKIEKATDSQVTMRMCADYLERKKELK